MDIWAWLAVTSWTFALEAPRSTAGELGQAQLVADGGDERVTNGIVSTGGAAGGDDDVNGSGGGYRSLVSPSVLGVSPSLRRRQQDEDHSDGQDEG